MKLAEALILRADTQRQVEQLKERLLRSVQVQEGDTPPEKPEILLQTLDSVFNQLSDLIQRINRTNARTPFGDEGKMLADALVERDSLLARRSSLQRIVDTATSNQHRYGRSEIKFVVTVDVVELQKEIDRISREFRELDTAIQQLNWTVDLAD
jgi:hypothetical protein